MRRILIFLTSCLSVMLNAEINRAWVGDTSKIILYIDYSNDTTFAIKQPFARGEWMLYHDKEFSKKAVHITYDAPYFDSIWYGNGQLKMAYTPQDSLCSRCPNSQLWYPNGQQEFSLKCNADSCVATWYYTSGRIKEISISRVIDSIRQPDHYSIAYYENGQLLHTAIDYTSNSMVNVKYYYESGQPRSEYSLVHGSHYGDYIQWHRNGQVAIKGQYKKRKRFKKNQSQEKTGTWYYYDESGKLAMEELYKDDKVIKTTGNLPMF